MAANISWFAGKNFQIDDLSGSGLGFYGDAGFGASVRVGEYNGRTFITDSTGSTQGAEVSSVKYLSPTEGILGQTGSGIALTAFCNHEATLNIRFTYDTAVKTQNAEFRIYDRNNINNPPSGVTVKVAEIIHPTITQVNNGSGDTTWITPAGSGVVVDLCPSPGLSGLYAGNGNDGQWSDTQHDWYLLISVSPDSIGAKTHLGAFVQLEYL